MANASTNAPEHELTALLRREEQYIVQTFPAERRSGVLEVSRAMDHLWIHLHLSQMKYPVAQRKLARFMTFGLNKALSLLVDGVYIYPSFQLFSSDERTQNWAGYVLQQCGRLGMCEHLLEICRIQLGELRKEGTDEFRFRFTAESMGAEVYEGQYFNWFNKYIYRTQKPLLRQLKAKKPRIQKMMAKRVRACENHFIHYDTSPQIDSFYQTDGRLYAQLMFGQDTFPETAVFGGLEFNIYCATVEILIGWAFRHLGFCEQLLRNHPGLEARNIRTIPQKVDEISDCLKTALNIDAEVAKQTMEVLTLTYENKGAHCSVPRDFVAPCFIEAGEGWVIRPVWGSLSHPFQFMLNELKRRYRSDWDRAVDLRENVFRRQLYELFKHDRFIKQDRNINIKLEGVIITDIDAMIFDRETGTVALFQLKWQDFFRSSMRGRESQRRIFYIRGTSGSDALAIGFQIPTSELSGRL